MGCIFVGESVVKIFYCLRKKVFGVSKFLVTHVFVVLKINFQVLILHGANTFKIYHALH